MKRVVVFCLFVLVSADVFALTLLENTIGPRPLSLGGAYVAVGGDNESIFWNPAGIPNVKYGSVSLGYQNRFLGFSYLEFYGSFKVPVKEIPLLDGVGGLGFAFWGTEEERWSDINELDGKVYANEYLFGLGYKKVFSDALSIGFALKLAGQSVDDVSSLSFVLDVGAISSVEGVGIGLAIKNIGIGSTNIDIPMGISLGAFYTVFNTPDNQHSVSLTGQLDSVYGSGFSLKVGSEYSWIPTFWDGVIRVRLGYDTLPSKDLGILSGLGGGFDVSWYGATLKYSLYNLGFIGASHNVQLSYDFDFLLKRTLAQDDKESPTISLLVRPKMIVMGNEKYGKINIDIDIADNVGIKYWGYRIIDSSENVVYYYDLTNAKSLPKVSKSIEWDGKSQVGSPLYDDIYKLKVFAYDDVGNVSEKVEKNIIISADPRNIILIPDKQVITSPTDKLTVSSFRDVSNVISYRIVVVSERDGSIIREFKESANIKLTKDGKIASGKPLEFKSIVWDLKKSDGELAEKGIYVVQGEFEFVGNVIRKSFPAEVRIDY
ncbi:MAG: hypothetical protein N3D81_04570 [Spirochaetes bacterium]|nr:hypothetical protein [Spirochaetota bacterium]